MVIVDVSVSHFEYSVSTYFVDSLSLSGSGVVRDYSGLAVSLSLSLVSREGLRHLTSATILSGSMKSTAKMATLKEW